jgi:hypothetical protein
MSTADLNPSVKKELLQQPEVIDYDIEGKTVHVNVRVFSIHQAVNNKIRMIVGKNNPGFNVKFNSPKIKLTAEILAKVKCIQKVEFDAKGNISLIEYKPGTTNPMKDSAEREVIAILGGRGTILRHEESIMIDKDMLAMLESVDVKEAPQTLEDPAQQHVAEMPSDPDIIRMDDGSQEFDMVNETKVKLA